VDTGLREENASKQKPELGSDLIRTETGSEPNRGAMASWLDDASARG
jgi:hypothetical protein